MWAYKVSINWGDYPKDNRVQYPNSYYDYRISVAQRHSPSNLIQVIITLMSRFSYLCSLNLDRGWSEAWLLLRDMFSFSSIIYANLFLMTCDELNDVLWFYLTFFDMRVMLEQITRWRNTIIMIICGIQHKKKLSYRTGSS